MNEPTLSAQFLDCGNGETIVLCLPGGDIGIVDCYLPDESTMARLFRHIDALLNPHRRIRFVCLSHAHRDHGLGMAEFIERYSTRIDEFWHSGTNLKAVLGSIVKAFPASKADFEECEGWLFRLYRKRKKLGIKARDLREGDEAMVADGVRISVVAPSMSEWRCFLRETGRLLIGTRNRATDRNEVSNALLVEYGSRYLVLSGDAPKCVWQWHGVQDVIEEKENLKYDVLKVPHHGSNTTFASEFYDNCGRAGGVVHFVVCGRSERDLAELGADILNLTKKRPTAQLHCVSRGASVALSIKSKDVLNALSRAVCCPTESAVVARVSVEGTVEVERVERCW